MLSKLDDYPIHQYPQPIAETVSSDRFTYDRYWYNAHAKDGSFYFGVALGRYPNLGILDCSLSLVIDGRQYAFHGSRRAPLEPTDMSVGPFSLQILEPMGRHRVVIEPNETGIDCDLVFTPRTAAIQENRQTMRNERHAVVDLCRLDQFGTWSGTIGYAGKKLTVEGDTTFGLKDKSWGVRPSGEAYAGGAPLADFQPAHFYWIPIHWEDECSLAGWFEDADGYQWHNDQAFLPIYNKPENIPGVTDPAAKIWKGTVEHQLAMEPGTRRTVSGNIVMQDSLGERLEISFEKPLLVHRMKGLG
ncbi:MAG: hypothetical protein HKO06_04775, partial [Pseudomonadales bacterium]|nr:hypothetical protein [Pseudomonadales bacterium]